MSSFIFSISVFEERLEFDAISILVSRSSLVSSLLIFIEVMISVIYEISVVIKSLIKVFSYNISRNLDISLKAIFYSNVDSSSFSFLTVTIWLISL